MTPLARMRFLAELAVSGNLSFACRAAPCTIHEALLDRQAFPQFERDWRLAAAVARTAAERRILAA